MNESKCNFIKCKSVCVILFGELGQKSDWVNWFSAIMGFGHLMLGWAWVIGLEKFGLVLMDSTYGYFSIDIILEWKVDPI